MTRLFTYRIRKQNGETARGILRANNIASAARTLQEDNYIVTDIKPASRLRAKYGGIQNLIHGGANMADLSLYCRQFATMIEAGVPITGALGVLAKQTANKTLAETSAKIVVLLKEGKTLAEAIEHFHPVFPRIFAKLAGVGEITGNLGGSLGQLSIHFEREYSLKEKVKTAMFYPTLVFGISLITTSVLVFFVLPQLVDVMVVQDIDIPLSTKLLLVLAGFVSGNWALLLMLLMIFLFAVRCFVRTEKGSDITDKLKLKVPFIAPLYRKELTCRFSRNLAILLRCGIPLVHSLDIVEGIMGSKTLEKAIRETKISIATGTGLSEPLAKGNVFPPMLIEMIKVGEKSGALDDLLEKTADFYDREIIKKLERLANLIEPTLIIFVGGVIALVLFSVIMPVLEVMNTI